MNRVKSFFDRVIDLIFPRKCIVCENIFDIRAKEKGVCEKCIAIFEKPSGKTCPKCGRETEQEYCYVCRRMLAGKVYKDKNFYFTRNYPIFMYNEASKESIFSLKYSKNLFVLKGFEQILRRGIDGLDIKADIVIPVPMYKKKERKRGFNQAKLIGKLVSDITKIPYNEKIIIRNRNTGVQSNKTLRHRHENLEGCFSVIKQEKIVGKVILLVDDIYTSGSTINMCAKELMQSGAKEVISLTLSIVPEKKDQVYEE